MTACQEKNITFFRHLTAIADNFIEYKKGLNMFFWEIVDSLIEKQGMSQAALSKAIGKERSQVNTWSKRGTVPPADYALKIAEILDVSLRYLVTGEEEARPILSKKEKKLFDLTKTMSENEIDKLIGIAEVLTADSQKTDMEDAG